MSGNDNSCSICLEPLLRSASSGNSGNDSNDIGAVVPCGHCFHMQCFAIWEANSRENRCKCPNCSQISKRCIRIFIAPPDNDESNVLDDVSINSVETTSDGAEGRNTDETTDKVKDNDKSDNGNNNNNNKDVDQANNVNESTNDDSSDIVEIVEPTGAVNNNRNGRLEVPGMVDLTQSTQQPSHTLSREVSLPISGRPGHSNQKSKVEDSTVDKYKAIAKRYKRCFQQKDSQFREQYQQYQALLEEQSDTKEELNKIKENMLMLEGMDEEKNARLDGAKLEIVQLRQQRDSNADQIRDLEQRNQTLATDYAQLQKSLQSQIDKARSSNMAEVHQLMEEHPKLLQQNGELKLKLSEMTTELSRLRQATGRDLRVQAQGVQLTNSTRHPETKTSTDLGAKKKRKASAWAKDLREMEQLKYATESSSVSFDNETSSKTQNGQMHQGRHLSKVGNRLLAYHQQRQQRKNRLISIGNGNTTSGTTILADSTNVGYATASRRLVSNQSLARSNFMETTDHGETFKAAVAKGNSRIGSTPSHTTQRQQETPINLDVSRSKHRKSSLSAAFSRVQR